MVFSWHLYPSAGSPYADHHRRSPDFQRFFVGERLCHVEEQLARMDGQLQFILVLFHFHLTLHIQLGQFRAVQINPRMAF